MTTELLTLFLQMLLHAILIKAIIQDRSPSTTFSFKILIVG